MRYWITSLAFVFAFTCAMAVGGFQGGTAYVSTDELGFQTQENPTRFYDVHATLLHLLGLDHEELTFYHNGIRRRLTDVHGEVIRGVLG